MSRIKIIITCEHASRKIPQRCAFLLRPEMAHFETHQIYDWGSKQIARAIAKELKAPLIEGKATRLAIELNRSLVSKTLFSPPLQAASETLKASLIADHYLPFREKTETRIRKWIKQGHTVLHLSLHSFTPVFKGRKRKVDIGVLFDPERALEASFGQVFMDTLQTRRPSLKVLPNQPYKGTDDGHTTALRKQFNDSYAGIELEYSQGLPLIEEADQWAADITLAYRALRTRLKGSHATGGRPPKLPTS